MTDQALDNLARKITLDAARLEYGSLIEELPERDFSPAFEQKMERLIRQADHPVRCRCLRAAQIAAVLAVLLTLVTVATAAAGYNIWGMLAEWTAETFTLAPGQIKYADPDDIRIPEEQKEYTSIQEALTDYGFDRAVVPKWMPEEFELEQLHVDNKTFPDEIVFAVCYTRGEDSLVAQIDVYLQHEGSIQDHFVNFQKDEGDPIPYEAGGVTHLLATNVGRPVALWASGPAECAISGDITMDELKRMIDSIYE